MVRQDWENTKGAYRFFSNERVSEEEILAGHFQSTRERALVQSDPVVVLHDTTEFIFKREDIDSLGRLNKGARRSNSGHGKSSKEPMRSKKNQPGPDTD